MQTLDQAFLLRSAMRAILAFVVAAGLVTRAFSADIISAQPTLPQSQLIVDTESGPKPFTIEMATTASQQEIGLMFRQTIAPNGGMLFPLHKVQKMSVWMKNTPIPLDLLFIRNDGTIAKIAANAKPFSTTNISSEERVRAVLEISGGRAAQLGITAGHKIRHFAGLAR